MFLTKKLETNSVLRFLKDYLCAVVLLLLCSLVRVNLLQVPFTMQVFGVLLVAVLYQARVVVASIPSALFLLANSPFSILSIFAPGYFCGFFLAAIFVSYFKNFCISPFARYLILQSASVMILLCGTIYISFSVGSLYDAFKIGFVPFLILDAFKVWMVLFVSELFKKT